jgi:hypothetical protein
MATPYVLHVTTVKRWNVMIPDELTVAARNLAHSLGIPVYIRDGRIYQHGPGIEFLPPKDPAASIAEDLSTIVDEDGFRLISSDGPQFSCVADCGLLHLPHESETG